MKIKTFKQFIAEEVQTPQWELSWFNPNRYIDMRKSGREVYLDHQRDLAKKREKYDLENDIPSTKSDNEKEVQKIRYYISDELEKRNFSSDEIEDILYMLRGAGYEDLMDVMMKAQTRISNEGLHEFILGLLDIPSNEDEDDLIDHILDTLTKRRWDAPSLDRVLHMIEDSSKETLTKILKKCYSDIADEDIFEFIQDGVA